MTTRIWTPKMETSSRPQVEGFIREVNRLHGVRIESFHGLYEWSVLHPKEFWITFWYWSGVQCVASPSAAFEPSGKIRPVWFPGARLNYAENLLAHRGDHPAIIFQHESGRRAEISWNELRARVQSLAQFLRSEGIQPGDVVGAVLPPTIETVIAMLSVAAIGAVWSSCSPDFGTPALLDRLSQANPRALFLTDEYTYKGAIHSLREKNNSLRTKLHGVKLIVGVPTPHSENDCVDGAKAWRDATNEGSSAVEYFHAPSDHPLAILFSSGTTGLPKCIVHSAGGTLLEHLKEHRLHCDLSSRDRIFYQTTCGWMMWNWLVSALATGATIVLYDGAPLEREGEILFDLIDDEQVTVFGTNAKYLSLVESMGVLPRKSHSLASLRTILSTGSILPGSSFDFVMQRVKSDVQLCSISGGTDIVGCWALGAPTLPVYRGELQTRSLGLAVEARSNSGEFVVGRRGELVCTAPFPSMPLGFLNDPGEERYRKSYFRDSPGVWFHGDEIEITPRGGVVFYGRTDAVLNPGGVRIGTGEIYAALSALPEIKEACAVARSEGNDEKIVLFVVLSDPSLFSESFVKKVRAEVRNRASPHHVPTYIAAAPSLPYTHNGKLAELAVRAALRGEAIPNLSSLSNPESLDWFRVWRPG